MSPFENPNFKMPLLGHAVKSLCDTFLLYIQAGTVKDDLILQRTTNG